MLPSLASWGHCRCDPSHSDIAVSRWGVPAPLGLWEQSLERGFEKMSFGAGM